MALHTMCNRNRTIRTSSITTVYFGCCNDDADDDDHHHGEDDHDDGHQRFFAFASPNRLGNSKLSNIIKDHKTLPNRLKFLPQAMH